MNLSLLGAKLGDLGDWPDLHTPPYPGPVLWVAGANSDYITPEYGPAMRALFPRTTAFTIKNAGHWVHSEQPEVFVGGAAPLPRPRLMVRVTSHDRGCIRGPRRLRKGRP